MSTPPATPTSRPVILVIDDDQAIRTALELVFEDDYEVLTCASGPEGIALMDERVHVVILDIRLRGEDGFWTYEAIRKRFERVPIVFFSAFQGLKDPYEIINDYRPFGYLQKDGELGELQQMVERAVEHHAEILQRDRHLFIADRRAAVGTLAVGAAHEINNPLGFIVSNLEFIKETMASDPVSFSHWPDLWRAVGDSLDGAWRIAKVVRDLQSFGRSPTTRSQRRTSVIAACELAAQMAHPEIRHRARLITEHETLPEVIADPDTLSQIFLNLLVNAAHVLPLGEANRNYILVRSRLAEGGIQVEITDSGPGVPEPIRGRIFDPFFTTKEPNEGTGLGLFVTHNLVESIGGSIELVDVPGEPGATFRVTLPLAPPVTSEGPRHEPEIHPEAPPPEPAATEPEPVRRRILIVDDDELVGRSLELVLPMHDVIYVENGKLALERIEQETFDFILCDVLMPQMGGLDLHRHLLRDHPEVVRSLVFMTGGVFDTATTMALDELDNLLLSKPISTELLLQTIESVARER